MELAAKRVDAGACVVFLYHTVSAPVALVVQDERPHWTWLLAALLTAVLHIAGRPAWLAGAFLVVAGALAIGLGRWSGVLSPGAHVLDAMRMAPVSLVAPAGEVELGAGIAAIAAS